MRRSSLAAVMAVAAGMAASSAMPGFPRKLHSTPVYGRRFSSDSNQNLAEEAQKEILEKAEAKRKRKAEKRLRDGVK